MDHLGPEEEMTKLPSLTDRTGRTGQECEAGIATKLMAVVVTAA